MRVFVQSLWCSIVTACQDAAAGWSRFWFTPTAPTTLALVRIGTGLVLLFVYVACTPQLMEFVGPNAWVDATAISHLRQMGHDRSTDYERVAHGWGGQSIWFYVTDPTLVWLTHAAFLACIVCFTVGI